MAKHSPYFFEDFTTFAVFPSVVDTVKRFGLGGKNKILKGIVYAIGNVSFYTDRYNIYIILDLLKISHCYSPNYTQH
jgi:hypothetical protein